MRLEMSFDADGSAFALVLFIRTWSRLSLA